MASAGELSGDYVGGGKKIAVLLQILPVGQGKVVGRLRVVSVDEKGELKVFDRPLTGAVNGESFIGKLEASWDKGGDVAISGGMTGRHLLISAANGLKAALRAGEEAQFNKAIEQLSREGSSIQQQAMLNEARRKSRDKSKRAASEIAGLRAKIEEFSSQEPRIVAERAREAQRYSHFTKKMQTKLSQLQTVTEQTGEAEGDRSSLNADIYHLSIDSGHIQIDVENSFVRFKNQAQWLLKGISEAQSACQRKHEEGIDDSRLREECHLLPDATTKLAKTSKSVKDFYEVLENAWLTNRTEQIAMLKQAESFKKLYSLDR